MARVSEKLSESVMSPSEASLLMREVVQPVSVKTALGRLTDDLAGWTANRVRDVWHADTRVRLDDRETKQLRALAAQQKREAAGADELRNLRARLDRIEAHLRQAGQDVDF